MKTEVDSLQGPLNKISVLFPCQLSKDHGLVKARDPLCAI
jgi:hypothetical protein